MREIIFLISFFVTCFVMYKIGWIIAHETIAKECKKLGKFYVDDEVFECVKVEKAHK